MQEDHAPLLGRGVLLLDVTGVLHCGGHRGEELQAYYSSGVQRSIWIEANPMLMPSLMQNCSYFPEAVAIQACLSDEDNVPMNLNISNNDGQSSSILPLGYHTIAHPDVHYVGYIPVTTKRIDTLFRELQADISNYSFVSMDLQGAELNALKGMGTLLNNVSVLYLEVNEKELYQGCGLIQDIDAYVSQFGFKRKEKQMWGNCGWGDAVYLKDSE